MKNPHKIITITIGTNYPNADGKTYAELKRLVEYFGRKPRHYAHMDVFVNDELFGEPVRNHRTDGHSNSTH